MQSAGNRIPVGFERFTEDLLRDVEGVEGYLASNEIRFLALIAACPTAAGEILEIGSFKGKSTIILAKSVCLADETIVNAVDPMTAPTDTDPSLRGAGSSLADFNRNIAEHGVESRIRFHQTYSYELAKTWNAPLRLLWIDGDHSYAGTKRDVEAFAPHLSDKGIIAIHDVLHAFEGGSRVFAEEILGSPNFGACGFCGSIAWAQFRADPRDTEDYASRKLSFSKRLERVIACSSPEPLKGFAKKKYKFYRWMIPHGRVDPQAWIDMVV